MTAKALRPEGIRAIIFDLDGTLYQDDRLGEEVNRSACRYVAHLKGITEAEAETVLAETRAKVGGGGTLSRSVVALGGTLKEMHRRFAAEIHPEELLRPDPRVISLLKRLGEKYQLDLYTNNNHALSGRIMAQIGITGLFQRVFTIEEFWAPKPDREVIEKILKEVGCKPQETLFVGDRYHVDLALPESLGCAIFETRTIEDLLRLAELLP